MSYKYNVFTKKLDYYSSATTSGLNHGSLSNLDYASAGHTGFQPAGDYVTDAEMTTISGDLVTGYTDADTVVTSVYIAADATLSGILAGDITSAISTAESYADSLVTTTSGDLVAGYTAADVVVTNTFGAADAIVLSTAEGYTDTVSGVLSAEIDSDISTHSTSGDHDGRYYTETELNDGQLDNRYYTEAEVDTISGSLNTKIDGKDNYQSWSFAVDGVTKDTITSADVLNFVGGGNITITRSADDQITISGTGGGVSDHGALTGLTDDDHPQYILVDGSRGFTATVSGITPTADNHLTTKAYVDGFLSINHIGTAGEAGFGLGICPTQTLPNGMTPLSGYSDTVSNNYGNYQYKDGSIMCWIPKFYYAIASGTNNVSIKGMDTYTNEQDANIAGYALHRSFIDGGVEQQGFFIDKYMCSKTAWGTGQIASSIKNGLPISTHVNHNPIADLTACSTNNYYQVITAAHARDGIDGAVNSSSIFNSVSKFQLAALALLSLAHGQVSSSTTYCAWYDATYNYPKGCNNNALKDYDEVSNGAGSGDDLLYVSDGYSFCGKTGSGVPFAKSTHNGQNCGVADLNGLMYEINIGVTCIASDGTVEDISRANPANIQETGHIKSTGDYVMLKGIADDDWAGLDDKLYQVTKIDANNYTFDDVDTSGFSTAWSGTNGGTTTNGTFYASKETTAMKDFTDGNSGVTDHWGAAGVAMMMDSFVLEFETAYPNNGFGQRMGSGSNQVLDTTVSGNGWLLTGIGFPKNNDAVDVTGTNQFGKDYFYQYVRNELCVPSCGYWYHTSYAGVWYSGLNDARTSSYSSVGFRSACYPE